jgi:hypothetical protein
MEGLETPWCSVHAMVGQNLIYVSKMDDVGVKTVFEKETCRMVRGKMVLLKGI